MALAAPPGSVVRPDVADKSMCPKSSDFLPHGPDDYYQERVRRRGQGQRAIRFCSGHVGA